MNRIVCDNRHQNFVRDIAIGFVVVLGIFDVEQSRADDRLVEPNPSTGASTVLGRTVQLTPAPNRLPLERELNQRPKIVIQAVSETRTDVGATSKQSSKVMQELELLYQKDGREMPDQPLMHPVPATGSQTSPAPGLIPMPVTPQQAKTTNPGVAQPARNQMIPPNRSVSNLTMPQAGGQSPQLKSQSSTNTPTPDGLSKRSTSKSKLGFLRSFLPNHTDQKSTAVLNGYRADIAPIPPTQQVLPPRFPGKNTLPTQPTQSQSRPRTIAGTNQAASTKPTVASTQMSESHPKSSIPVLSNIPSQPTGLTVQSQQSSNDILGIGKAQPDIATPQSMSLLQPSQVLGTPYSSGEVSALVVSNNNNDLNNVFTENSEEDTKIENIEDIDKDQENGPFTGKRLSDGRKAETTPTGQPSDSPKISSAPHSDASEDPFADELRKMGIIPDSVTTDVTAETSDQEKKSLEIEDDETDAARENAEKIRERGGMRGLKGFCPVTLRDNRKLLDSRSELFAMHRGQTFHFANEDARTKFEQDPVRYAPAVFGADVLALSRHQEVVEGSLDFATWYKGRLFLFASKETHDTFIESPAEFATPAGIE